MAALDFPASPTNGQVYANWIYSTAKGAWQAKPITGKVTTSSVAPAAPTNGDEWFNTNDGNLYVYYTDVDGSQWVQVKSDATLSSTLGNRVTALETHASGTSRYTAGAILGTSYSTFATVTITSTGRPIKIDGSVTYNNANSGGNKTVDWRVQLDGVTLNEELTGLISVWVSGQATPTTSADFFLTTPTAGSRTITLQAKASASSSVGLTRASLTVVEL
jgi:hypothetical protein